MALIFQQLTELVLKVRDLKQQIRTQEFLEICRHIVPITDKFGASFALVRSDVNGNISRLDTARQRDVDKFQLLLSIVLDEIERGKQADTYSDARALLWLKRAMEFIENLLQRLYNDREVSMATAASDAYTATLYQYHTWYTAAAFTVALKLVPTRETFFSKLGVESEEGIHDMQTFLEAFRPILAEIQEFLKQHDLDDPTRV